MKRLIIGVISAITLTAAPAMAHETPAGGVSAETIAVVKAYIMDVFGPLNGPRAIRIAACESGFNPEALNHNKNGTHDGGIFQLNSGGTVQSLGLTFNETKDYKKNIEAAYRLFRQRGWRPWVCRG